MIPQMGAGYRVSGQSATGKGTLGASPSPLWNSLTARDGILPAYAHAHARRAFPTRLRAACVACKESDLHMQITVNGEQRQAPPDTTVATLLQALKLSGRRIAVERNGAIIPHSAYSDERLEDGDQLEIIHAIGGG